MYTFRRLGKYKKGSVAQIVLGEKDVGVIIELLG